MDSWILGAIIFVWLAYAAHVIWAADDANLYSRNQMLFQSALAITIPLFGAVAVHIMLLSNTAVPPRADSNHAAQSDQVGMSDTAHYPHSSGEQ